MSVPTVTVAAAFIIMSQNLSLSEMPLRSLADWAALGRP